LQRKSQIYHIGYVPEMDLNGQEAGLAGRIAASSHLNLGRALQALTEIRYRSRSVANCSWIILLAD
jgi:hypothetical protein